jgi:hypothetical protein
VIEQQVESDLVGLPSTSVLARTTPLVWSRAVITCRAAVSVVRDPRSDLPSTAIARRPV